MMSDTVLVTGGGGFLASWTIVELLRRGYTVRATVRLAKEPQLGAQIARQVDHGDRLSVVAADLTADAGWDAAASDLTSSAPSSRSAASWRGASAIGACRPRTSPN